VDVGEVMTRDVVTIAADATLREAATLLLGRRIGCLPVVKPDRTLIGLVTETDLLRAAFLSDDDAIECEVVEEAEK
jgi:CBS domain-containing protein